MSKSTIRPASASSVDSSQTYEHAVQVLIVRASDDPSIGTHNDADMANRADAAIGSISNYFGGQGLSAPRYIKSKVFRSPYRSAQLLSEATASGGIYGQSVSYMLWVRIVHDAYQTGILQAPDRNTLLVTVYLGGEYQAGPGYSVGANDIWSYPSGRYATTPGLATWVLPGGTGISGPRAYWWLGIDPKTIGVPWSEWFSNAQDPNLGSIAHEMAHCMGNGEDHMLHDGGTNLMSGALWGYPNVPLSAMEKAILKTSPFLGDWEGLSNLAANDSSCATISSTRRRLMLRNFGFGSGVDAIPPTAIIEAIHVRMWRTANENGADGSGRQKYVSDYSVRLLKGSVVVGDSASGGSHWGAADPITFGTRDPLWGVTWSRAEVCDSGFGIEYIPYVYCQLWDGSATPVPAGFVAPVIGSLNFVEIEVVWHTAPTSPTLTAPTSA